MSKALDTRIFGTSQPIKAICFCNKVKDYAKTKIQDFNTKVLFDSIIVSEKNFFVNDAPFIHSYSVLATESQIKHLVPNGKHLLSALNYCESINLKDFILPIIVLFQDKAILMPKSVIKAQISYVSDGIVNMDMDILPQRLKTKHLAQYVLFSKVNIVYEH